MVLFTHVGYGLFPGGFLGVDIFFVISGYLITSLLWKEHELSGRISLKNFYARRILRLYPPLLVTVALANVLWTYSFLPVESDRMIASLASMFYFANIVDERVMGNMHHLWSLAVEEHFYFLWPLVIIWMLSSATDSQRKWSIVALLVATSVFRIVAGLHQGEWRYGLFIIDAYGFTFCRIDCILLGALMYFVSDQKSLLESSRKKAWDVALLILCATFFLVCGFLLQLSNPRWLSGGFLLTNLFSAVAVFVALRNANSPIVANDVLVWVGRRSYGLYLYHVPIAMALEPLRVTDDKANFIFVTTLRIVLSLVAAALSYEFIEKPVLQYKRRFSVA